MTHARQIAVAVALMLTGVGVAQAACPPLLEGDTAGVLASNRQRLICLNREIDNSAADRQRDMQFRMLNNSVQAETIQRRFDDLPVYQPPKF